MAITYDQQYDIDSIPYSANNDTYIRVMRYDASAASYSSNLKSLSTFDYFGDSATVGDILYIGYANIVQTGTFWHNVRFNVGTPLAATSITVAYEYYNGSWTAIPNLIDQTNIFQNAGVNTICFERPVDSYGLAVYGTTHLHWIRIRITAVSGLTEGGAQATDKIKVNSSLLENTNLTDIDFDDLHTADIGGSRELLCTMSAASNLSLYCQPKPAEWGAIKLDCIVTNYSGAGTITLTGADGAGNTISESISVTGNATYTSVKSYAAIDSGGVDCTGTYDIQITQPRWGVIHKYNAQNYEFNKAIILNGDGTNESRLIESGKTLYMEYSILINHNNSFVEFGAIDSGVLKYPMSICYHNEYMPSRRLNYVYIARAGSTTNFYNLSWDGLHPVYNTRVSVEGGTIKGCKFAQIYDLILQNKDADVSDTTVNYSSIWHFALYDAGQSISDVKGENASYGFLFIQGNTTDRNSPDIQKVIRGNTVGGAYDFNQYSSGYGAVFIDPVFTPDYSRTRLNANANQLYIAYFDYSFNLRFLDEWGNAIQGVQALLYDKDSNEIFNVLSAASGSITEQEVTAQTFSHTWAGGGIQSYGADDVTVLSPFKLVVKNAGREYPPTIFTLDEPVNWRITLKRSVLSLTDKVAIHA